MSFQNGITGLNAASNQLDVVSNNIANVATSGFKRSRAEFADLYVNGGGSNAIGSGVMLARVSQDFSQGSIEFSNNTLDLAINGDGFFVLQNNGTNVYSRAGAFQPDNNGFIVNNLGQRLQGYQADQNGNILPLSGDLQLSNNNMGANSTTSVQVGANLYSASSPPTVAWTGGASPVTDTYNNVTSTTIYDSLGNTHVLSMYFIHADPDAAAGDPNASLPVNTFNQWYVGFQIDNQNVPANAGTTNASNLYAVNFNSDGSFSSVQDTTGATIPTNLIPLSMTLTNGANPLNFSVDLSTCTQFGSPFSTQTNRQDGFTTGSLDSWYVSDAGIIFSRYTNGQSQAVGQVMLANFSNPYGLQNLSNTGWAETAESGQPSIGAPGTGTLGPIQSGALESANVDLTKELVDMITAQRNFQANAQTIRTEDAVTQTIINIR